MTGNRHFLIPPPEPERGGSTLAYLVALVAWLKALAKWLNTSPSALSPTITVMTPDAPVPGRDPVTGERSAGDCPLLRVDPSDQARLVLGGGTAKVWNDYLDEVPPRRLAKAHLEAGQYRFGPVGCAVEPT